MILQQVRDEANQVNRVLDEFDSLSRGRKDRDERRRLLYRASLASVRGMQALIEDRQGQRTLNFAPEDPDMWRLLEDLRQDEALMRMFMRTEARLLEDIGVDPELVRRLELSLGEVMLELEGNAEPSEERLYELIEVFESSLMELEAQGRDREIVARLTGVVQALGGALIVGVNGVAGVGSAAGTLGVTTALSAAGAALSMTAGGEVMNRGAARARG